MKKTLLITILLGGYAASAQTVHNFYPLNSTPTSYYLSESDPAINETPAGTNAVWAFNGLTSYGTSQTTVVAPTETQVAAYPGTTAIVETTSQGDATQFYLAHAISGEVSVTGIDYAGVNLNYSTNNANLGIFPRYFENAALTDPVAGTFSADTFNGTFTGTCTTSVDAFGTITGFTDGSMPIALTVTRLKIEQNLTLYLFGAPVGTINQVMYSYHSDIPATAPVFRTITATVDITGIVSQSQQSIESYYNPTATIQNPEIAYVTIAPNPVTDILHFEGDNAFETVTITDTAGRTVVTANCNDINVAHLSAGVYIATARAGKNSLTQKFIKK